MGLLSSRIPDHSSSRAEFLFQFFLLNAPPPSSGKAKKTPWNPPRFCSVLPSSIYPQPIFLHACLTSWKSDGWQWFMVVDAGARGVPVVGAWARFPSQSCRACRVLHLFGAPKPFPNSCPAQLPWLKPFFFQCCHSGIFRSLPDPSTALSFGKSCPDELPLCKYTFLCKKQAPNSDLCRVYFWTWIFLLLFFFFLSHVRDCAARP